MGEHAEAIEQATRARRLAERAGDGTSRRGDARARAFRERRRTDAAGRTVLRGSARPVRGRGRPAGTGVGPAPAVARPGGGRGSSASSTICASAYALFTRARDRFGRAVVAHDLAYILSVEGGPSSAVGTSRRGGSTEDEGDLRSRALLLRTWGSYCYSSGRFTEAAEAMARAAARRRGGRAVRGSRRARDRRARGRERRRARGASRRWSREAIALGRELGSVRTPALARLAAARAAVRQGRSLDVGGPRAARGARGRPDAGGSRDVRRRRRGRGDGRARPGRVGRPSTDPRARRGARRRPDVAVGAAAVADPRAGAAGGGTGA